MDGNSPAASQVSHFLTSCRFRYMAINTSLQENSGKAEKGRIIKLHTDRNAFSHAGWPPAQ